MAFGTKEMLITAALSAASAAAAGGGVVAYNKYFAGGERQIASADGAVARQVQAAESLAIPTEAPASYGPDELCYGPGGPAGGTFFCQDLATARVGGAADTAPPIPCDAPGMSTNPQCGHEPSWYDDGLQQYKHNFGKRD